MTGRKNCALQVPPVVPYKALENFSKALYGTTGGTFSARFFRPLITRRNNFISKKLCLISPSPGILDTLAEEEESNSENEDDFVDIDLVALQVAA